MGNTLRKFISTGKNSDLHPCGACLEGCHKFDPNDTKTVQAIQETRKRIADVALATYTIYTESLHTKCDNIAPHSVVNFRHFIRNEFYDELKFDLQDTTKLEILRKLLIKRHESHTASQ